MLKILKIHEVNLCAKNGPVWCGFCERKAWIGMQKWRWLVNDGDEWQRSLLVHSLYRWRRRIKIHFRILVTWRVLALLYSESCTSFAQASSHRTFGYFILLISKYAAGEKQVYIHQPPTLFDTIERWKGGIRKEEVRKGREERHQSVNTKHVRSHWFQRESQIERIGAWQQMCFLSFEKKPMNWRCFKIVLMSRSGLAFTFGLAHQIGDHLIYPWPKFLPWHNVSRFVSASRQALTLADYLLNGIISYTFQCPIMRVLLLSVDAGLQENTLCHTNCSDSNSGLPISNQQSEILQTTP